MSPTDLYPSPADPNGDPRLVLAAILSSLSGSSGSARHLLHGLTPPKPFQFPSLAHLDETVDAAVQRARDTEGLRPTTLRWVSRSYRLFRGFLTASESDQRFLSGNIDEQVVVLEAWVADLRRREVSRVAINSYWRGVLSLFRWIGRRHSAVNPLLFAPTPRAGRMNPRVLTRKSAETVLEFVRNYPWRSALERTRNVTIVGLMLLAGLRRGETVRLLYGDVDPDGGTIRIRSGKGPNGGKDRTAYMPPQLRELLRSYQQRRREAGRTHAEFLTSLRANTGISEGPIAKLFRFISKGSGVAVNPHALRHTYATLLRQAGIPDRVSMELLGHSSLSMLQRYSHVFSEEPGQAASRLTLDVGI
ncbi:MAG: site-specific integrase [Thermoanaerobaculia bacterium]